MRVLLLGSNGQLGSDLIRVAAERGTASGLQLFPLTRADVDCQHTDQIASVLSHHAFDALINCVGYHKTDEVESEARKAVAINAHAVRVLAECCAAKGARLVQISTDYVFDGLSDHPYTETDSVGPLNVYGASKAMGEALARAVCGDLLVFRVASLFGIAGSSGKGANFVETILRLARQRSRLRVIADQVMSPTATADVARMILTALESNIPAGTYHAVNSGHASWYEFAARIIDRTGTNATIAPIPAAEYHAPARRPAFSVLDNTKLSGQMGPIPDWHDALDRYLVAKGHSAARHNAASR